MSTGTDTDKESTSVTELCEQCPNEECPGALHADDEHACHTLQSWLDGKKTFRSALGAKRSQAARHRRTDAFREWVIQYLTAWDREHPGCNPDATPKGRKTFAIQAAKYNHPASEVDENKDVPTYPDSVYEDIEEARENLRRL